MGPPVLPPLLGDYAGTQSGAERRAGARGEPCISRVSSVESGGGVCARGLPHTVPHPHNCPLRCVCCTSLSSLCLLRLSTEQIKQQSLSTS